jgi:hypothetical protein
MIAISPLMGVSINVNTFTYTYIYADVTRGAHRSLVGVWGFVKGSCPSSQHFLTLPKAMVPCSIGRMKRGE